MFDARLLPLQRRLLHGPARGLHGAGIRADWITLAGFGLGLLAHRYARLRHGIELCLDVMQTIPAFAYLIPILLLFGFGPVVGLIASATLVAISLI